MDENYKKLAQLCAIIETQTIKKGFIFNKFIDLNAHMLNCQIPKNNYFKLMKPDLIGNTPLHIALTMNEFKIFEKLIELGADYTIKNGHGETVFHQAIRQYLQDYNMRKWKKTPALFFADILLSAIVSSQNTTNPLSHDGISHFHIACVSNCTKAVELFLNDGVSVDQTVNFDSPILPGYTPLHFAARYFCLETMEVLLKRGANVHLKDARGMSPLHMLIDENMKLCNTKLNGDSSSFGIFEDEDDSESKNCIHNREFKEFKIVKFDDSKIVQEKLELNKKMIQLILIECNATEDWKIVDDTALSNLHVACCLQDFPMIKQLLRSIQNLDHCIKMDSRVCPGYTALHFAAHVNLDVVKFLLSHGTNILAKDATGITPLDLCLAKYNFHRISPIIESQRNWKNTLFTDGKTKLFDFIRSMKKTSSFNTFLKDVDVNIAIPRDLTLWPGYTLLHLTITLSQCDLRKTEQKIKKLLNLGADVTFQNIRGWTPLHLAFQANKLSIVNLLLEQHPDNVNPVDENGFSHLHIACIQRSNREKFLNGPNINSSVKTTFTVLHSNDLRSRELHVSAGCTPLHIAIVQNDYYSTKVTIELIEHGADVCSRDIDGFTPLHHAFMRRTNYGWDESLWKKIFSLSDLENCVADCGVSHLHIACFIKNTKAVERMLDLGADINAMITDTSPKFSIDLVRDKEKKNYHFHDIVCFARCFAGYTPLGFALDASCDEVISILLRRGADVLTRKPDGSVWLSRLLERSQKRTFFRIYKNDENMQKYIERETGLTILHFACAAFNFDAVVKSLDRIDVNSCAHSDSPIWPGCTPLHVLVIKEKSTFYSDERECVCKLIELLIGKGANVVLRNAEQKTPLHEAVDRSPLFKNGYPLKLELAILILKNYTNYAINPVDARGISHFHIACLCNDVTSVEKFLEHGVDVDQPINYFAESCGGYTPLHLAAVQKCRETIALLLQYKADVNAKNLLGESPIQTIAFRSGIKKEDLDPFIEAGADINGQDLFGDTPLESLIRDNISWNDNEIRDTVVNYKCRVNVFYPRGQHGFIGCRFQTENPTPSRNQIISDPLARTLGPFVRAAIDAPEVNHVDFLGRSVIHNIVSTDNLFRKSFLETNDLEKKYDKAIEELVKAGFNIDHRDRRGYTPLHVAVYLENVGGVKGLLMNGADGNLVDKKGKPAYAYLERYQISEFEDFDLTNINEELYRHFKKLQILKLPICSANQIIISQDLVFLEDDWDTNKKHTDFLKDVHKSTLKTIEPYPIRLHDFLSETGAVSVYVFKSFVEKEAIAKFFLTNHTYLRENFPELVGILYLQYRKAVARKNLIEPANTSLSILLGLDLPHLCWEAVLKFLSNDELKLLIASTRDK